MSLVTNSKLFIFISPTKFLIVFVYHIMKSFGILGIDLKKHLR